MGIILPDLEFFVELTKKDNRGILELRFSVIKRRVEPQGEVHLGWNKPGELGIFGLDASFGRFEDSDNFADRRFRKDVYDQKGNIDPTKGPETTFLLEPSMEKVWLLLNGRRWIISNMLIWQQRKYLLPEQVNAYVTKNALGTPPNNQSPSLENPDS